MENMAQCDSTNKRNESLQDVFSVNTFLLLCPRLYCTDVLMRIVAIPFQQCAEATAPGRGAPLSVVVQDNISLPRPARLRGPQPVILTHLQGMKSEECTLNLHPLLSLQRRIDGGPFMEPDQDLQAPTLSVCSCLPSPFHPWLFFLLLCTDCTQQ